MDDTALIYCLWKAIDAQGLVMRADLDNRAVIASAILRIDALLKENARLRETVVENQKAKEDQCQTTRSTS